MHGRPIGGCLPAVAISSLDRLTATRLNPQALAANASRACPTR